jgi:regulatory protein YycI of two-component signal transduction system YycFG
MSTEEAITQGETKKGLNLNLKASPFTIIMAMVSLIVNIVLVVRFADTKTSREDVKEIANNEVRVLGESQKSMIQTLSEIKTDIRFLKGENEPR